MGIKNKSAGGSTSNILLKHSFRGNLRSDEGFLSAIGDLATLTANSGKDMYVTSAKVVFYYNADSQSGGGFAQSVVLKLNGVVVETAKFSAKSIGTTTQGTGVLSDVYEFNNLFGKVTAGQIIKLEVLVNDTKIDVDGFIQCLEVDTGVDPTL